MSEHDVTKSYLDKVCSAVRWKQAHETIRRELSDHIEDQAEAFMAEGMPSDAAMERAILEMGDAEEVGFGLDASYRPREVKGIAIPIAGLVLIGIICRIWVTNTPVDVKYITAIIIGAVCAFALYNVNLYKFAKYSGIAFISGLAVMFVLLMIMYTRYSYHFRFNNPIVYYAACFSPVVYAGLVYSMRDTGIKGLLLCGIAAAALCMMLLLIPSWTGILSVVVSYLIVLTAAILLGVFGPRKALSLAVVLGGIFISAVILLSLMSEYFHYRLMFILHPELEPSSIGYIGSIIREIVANARFIGASDHVVAAIDRGADFVNEFLLSIKWDFLLTIIIHRYGWLSAIAVMLVLANFIATGFKHVFRLGSTLGKLLGCGLMASFTVQIASYVLYNMGVIIGGPLPLPFISAGNTCHVINCAMAGMLLSLLRTDGLYTDTPSVKAKRLRVRFEWE